MKALTVRQPWASLIVHGVKHIETRSKPTKIRGRIGIIAGKHWLPLGGIRLGAWGAMNTITDPAYQGPHAVNPKTGRTSRVPRRALTPTLFWPRTGPDARMREDKPEYAHSEYLPLGALLGTVELYDCVPIVDGPFAPSRRIQPHCAGGGLELAEADVRTECDAFSPGETLDVTDQLPYGDFTPGRFAWLLRDPQPLAEPIGMRGALHWQEVEL